MTLDDISRAMDRALRDLPSNSSSDIQPFSALPIPPAGRWCVTEWTAFTAPGNSRVGRLKSWFSGVEPGQRVLDWLCLGSDGQWTLNENYLKYNFAKNGFYPFVLTGQGIDEKFYDFLNNYLVEKGSDGVVRVAGANMNYRRGSLAQDSAEVIRKRPMTFAFKPSGPVKKSKPVPLGVYSSYSHSGTKMGIMRSIKNDDAAASVVGDILKCFPVDSPDAGARQLYLLTNDNYTYR